MKPLLAALAGLVAAGLAAAEGLVADTSFDNTVTTGAVLITVILGLGTVVGVIYGARYKVGYEAASAAARELRSALDDANRREDDTKRALDASKESNARLREEMKKMEALPNLAVIIDKMAETARRQDEEAKGRLILALDSVEESFDARVTAHELEARKWHQELVAELRRMRSTPSS